MKIKIATGSMSVRQFSIGEFLAYTTVVAVVLPFWYLAHRHPVVVYPAAVLSGVLLCGPIGFALGGRKWFFPAMFVGGAVSFVAAIVLLVIMVARVT